MKTGLRLHWKIILAFGSAVLVLLAVCVISYRGMLVSATSEFWVRHTNEVLENLDELRFAVTDAQTSHHALVFTDKGSDLVAYRTARAAAMQSESNLRLLTADNPLQQERLPRLHELLGTVLQPAEKIEAQLRTRGPAAVAGLLHDGLDPRPMEEFRGVVRQMRNEELRLLVSREADARRRQSEARTTLVLGTVLGLLIAAAAGWSALRDISRRGLAVAALRDSEERYLTLRDGVQDYAISMLDPRGTVLSWNAGAEHLTGYTAAQIVGHSSSCFFPPEAIARGRLAEVLRLSAASGRYEEQAVRVRKDGARFMAHVTVTALRDPAGQLRGFSEISRDLTETKESVAKYRGLLEAAPDAMVVVNEAGAIVLLNAQAEKQFGYRRDELVGQSVKEIVPQGFAERLIADGTRTAAEALAQQIGTGIELSGRRKDGSSFPIEIMLSPLDSVEGILVTAAIRDISVRRAAEQHLAQMEGRYRGLLEAAPDAMVVVDQAGVIVLLNAQAEKQFGYRRDELVGQAVTNIIPDGFAERLVADALRSTEDALAQQIGTGIELIGHRKSGDQFPIEIMLSPLASAEGILVTAAIRDITARKLSEAYLLHKVDELNRSNEELGQFAYIASHDLQEPLRMVASYTQLLSRRYTGRLDSDADDFIAFAVDGATRMQRLIQDLLAYSRIGTKGGELIETSSEDACQQALSNLRGAIDESGAQVTSDALPVVLADEMQLIQLFQNLVGNGIKYQNAGVPRVHISAAKSIDERWIFSVQDNGLGIDPQYFDKIFGMFQRLHKRDEFAGTGIGLAICKKIVTRHGGAISVDSQPGKGSTFRFALAGGEMTHETSRG